MVGYLYLKTSQYGQDSEYVTSKHLPGGSVGGLVGCTVVTDVDAGVFVSVEVRVSFSVVTSVLSVVPVVS